VDGTRSRNPVSRLWSVVVFGALALFAATTGPASSAATVTTAVCPTSGLVVWLNNEAGGAAAGSTYYKLEFTNLSGRTCTLRGYAGVSAVDLRSRQLGSEAGRNPTHAPSTITLRPGASAVAVLQVADAYNYPAATCRRTTAAGLRVYPPNQTQSRLVPFPFLACSRSGPVYLHVAPVQRA
jgi:hypothetical protein